MQIACVFVGNKYPAEYIHRLKRGVERFASEPVEFVCYADRPVDGVAYRPLETSLGWFSKIELFKFKEPMLYLDLDVVVTGDLAPAWHAAEFTIIKDWWWSGFNSSVMRLTGQESHVWDNFDLDCIARLPMGDQQWITQQLPDAKTFPSEMFPSYKAMKCHAGAPAGALAVVMHGRPKPHEFTAGWVKDAWI